MLTEYPKGDTAILTNHICFDPAVTDGDLRGRAAGGDVPHGRTGQQSGKGPLRDGSRRSQRGSFRPGAGPSALHGGSAAPAPLRRGVKQEVKEQAATTATSMKSQDVKLPCGTLGSPLRPQHTQYDKLGKQKNFKKANKRPRTTQTPQRQRFKF